MAIAAIAVFLASKALIGVAAFSSYRSARNASGERVDARVIEAKWASLGTWHVLDRTPRRLRVWRTAMRGPAAEILSWPLARETAAIRTSRSFSTVRNFLHVHTLGFPVVIPEGEGGSLVLWSDIRFCWDASRQPAPVIDPIVQSDDGSSRIACALWFGGELDADGNPVREIVRVGGVIQSRAAAR